MKKEYILPTIEVVEVELDDVILESAKLGNWMPNDQEVDFDEI